MGSPHSNRKLEDLLRTDFSMEDKSKEAIRNRLLQKIHNQNDHGEEREGASSLKRSFPKKQFKPVFTVVLMGMLLGSFSVTSYGQSFYQAVKEIFIGKYAKFHVSEKTDHNIIPIPQQLRGRLYDQNGNVLDHFPIDGKIYNKNGEEVILSVNLSPEEDGNLMTEYEILTDAEFDARRNRNKTDLSDLEEAKSYVVFDFLLPSYLPEGYAFDRVEMFHDEEGKIAKDSEYANIYFSNGDRTKDISLHLRLMNEETAFETDLADGKRS